MKTHSIMDNREGPSPPGPSKKHALREVWFQKETTWNTMLEASG